MGGFDPTRFDSIGGAADSKESAQWWLLFSVIVAGKNAEFATKALTRLMSMGYVRTGMSPFERVKKLASDGELLQALVNSRTGNYNKIEKAFREFIQLKNDRKAEYFFGPYERDDPRTWSLELLESVHGVGPKTARWFFMLCHPDAQVAALDTHVLKFLRDNGMPDAPKATPPAGRKYRELEARFLELVAKLGQPVRDVDWMVWAIYRAGGKIILEG